MTATTHTFRDGLGVTIEVGDRVTITAWGGSVRLDDIRQEGLVTGLVRTRIRVSWDKTSDAPKANVDPAYVAVQRRDGEPGFQGNLHR